ncbi:MAG TPA: protein translocase subunit SecDF [Salinivirga sp.]|uniref:protein translocase subunit SecDF n=1 Tax=Salinivirga sp. TaxID=1970192 RepID=UPI002B4A8E43|nr:protein translocase subunit SecDF [Salinivirga sp.]HKK59082.1 protein translocase subunit SecDF [Salinivirga sp.]
MQNKGVIRFIAIALALVVIYQLSFTFVTSMVSSDAEEYAEGIVANAKKSEKDLSEEELNELKKEKKNHYLDSIAGEPVYNFIGIREFTYRECQEREINLGLDLRGGMNVILEISVSDVIKALAGNSDDPDFLAALDRAKEYQKETQEDFVTLFGRAYEEIAPEGRLATIFSTKDLREKVNFNSTNDEVLEVIRKETDGAISNAFNVLRNRIDRFGVAQPVIQPLETDGQILIELPGIKNPERVRKLLKGTAKLEFWETYSNKDVYEYLFRANDKIRSLQKIEETQQDSVKAADAAEEEVAQASEEEAQTEEADLLAEEDDLLSEDSSLIAEDTTSMSDAQMRAQNPLFSVLMPRVSQDGKLMPGASVGYAHFSDTAQVNEYLHMPEVQEIFPRSMRIMFRWNVQPIDEEGNIYELVALKVSNMDGEPALSGDVVTDARADFNSQTGGSAEVSMSMNTEGAKKWARLTRNNIGNQIAIVLDNYVYSYPRVNQEIKGGRSSITGQFSVAEAKDLANVLKSGKLPAPARIIQEEIVGPSLGQESITKGLWSFVIAFLVVMLYMIFYYRHAGWVANLALIINMFFITGILASLGAVLTLPGIAGIVLTIGMSVDANVLIYERIKEELNAGKGLRMALSDGYKNAYSAIIDSNLTTLLTAIILGYFGKGPIYGFAITLGIGIITSLFSAIFITRLIYEGFLGKKKNIAFASKLTQNAFKNTAVKFIEKRKIAYVISGIVIIIGVGSLVTRGLNLGVDFTGGHNYIVRFQDDVSVNSIKNDLEDEFGGEAPEVKTFGGNNQIKVTTKYLIDTDYELTDADKQQFYNITGFAQDVQVDIDDFVEAKLYQGLKPYLGDVDYQMFISDQDKKVGRMSSQKVGPTIADDIKTSAVYAVIFSLIIIFLYILIRFSNWQFGLGAVAALLHDVLFILGIYSLFYTIMPFSMEIDQSFIAAILTVVGYSINDTVVVFDRIREYLGLYKKRGRKEILNTALNSTLARTFSTSLSTFVVLLTIFIFGGEMIRGFIFAMLVGVAVGTYSSLFIATPVVYDTVKADERKRALKGARK